MDFLKSFFSLTFVLYVAAIAVGFSIIDVDTVREWFGATFVLASGVIYGGLDD